MSTFEIRTCSDSLTTPAACCVCRQQATMAVLTTDMVEHARCLRHSTGDDKLASKPLVWSDDWAPTC